MMLGRLHHNDLPYVTASVEDWDRIFQINVRGVFLCVREAGEQMIKQGTGGKIIGEVFADPAWR
jgi:NAD(P)-dependent dehydrogenase (short-subunit alcohol dehydrogenase family)